MESLQVLCVRCVGRLDVFPKLDEEKLTMLPVHLLQIVFAYMREEDRLWPDILAQFFKTPIAFVNLKDNFWLSDAVFTSLPERSQIQVPQKLRSIIKRKLKHLSLSGCRSISDYAISQIALSCGPNLVRISLKDCKKLTDEGIRELTARCPNVTYISMSGCRLVTDVGVLSVAKTYNTNLKVLKFCEAPKITIDPIVGLSECCSELRVLHLSNCNAIKDVQEMLSLLSRGCSKLVGLRVMHCSNLIPHKPIEVNFPQLKLLNLKALGNPKGKANYLTSRSSVLPVLNTRFLEGCPRLEHLSLSRTLLTDESLHIPPVLADTIKTLNLNSVHNTRLSSIAITKLLLVCTNLETLKIANGLTIVNDSALLPLDRTLYLQTLILAAAKNKNNNNDNNGNNDNNDNSDDNNTSQHTKSNENEVVLPELVDVGEISNRMVRLDLCRTAVKNPPLQRCVNLRHLKLTSCLIGDSCLINLAKNCSLLEFLILNDCNRITDKGISVLQANCRGLKQLDLAKCRKLQAPVIHLPELRKLDLGATCIESPSISCPLLTHLSLSNCEKLPETALLDILSACPLLQGIKMCAIASCTDTTIAALTRFCPGTRLLSISATEISEHAVVLLVARLPFIRRLYLNGCPNVRDSFVTALKEETKQRVFIIKNEERARSCKNK